MGDTWQKLSLADVLINPGNELFVYVNSPAPVTLARLCVAHRCGRELCVMSRAPNG